MGGSRFSGRVTGARTLARLADFKAGTGIYGRQSMLKREKLAPTPPPAVSTANYRAAVDDAEGLEPYVGAKRAWALACLFHGVVN